MCGFFLFFVNFLSFNIILTLFCCLFCDLASQDFVVSKKNILYISVCEGVCLYARCLYQCYWIQVCIESYLIFFPLRVFMLSQQTQRYVITPHSFRVKSRFKFPWGLSCFVYILYIYIYSESVALHSCHYETSLAMHKSQFIAKLRRNLCILLLRFRQEFVTSLMSELLTVDYQCVCVLRVV